MLYIEKRVKMLINANENRVDIWCLISDEYFCIFYRSQARTDQLFADTFGCVIEREVSDL
jgi:hypothetical protein